MALRQPGTVPPSFPRSSDLQELPDKELACVIAGVRGDVFERENVAKEIIKVWFFCVAGPYAGKSIVESYWLDDRARNDRRGEGYHALDALVTSAKGEPYDEAYPDTIAASLLNSLCMVRAKEIQTKNGPAYIAGGVQFDLSDDIREKLCLRISQNPTATAMMGSLRHESERCKRVLAQYVETGVYPSPVRLDTPVAPVADRAAFVDENIPF